MTETRAAALAFLSLGLAACAGAPERPSSSAPPKSPAEEIIEVTAEGAANVIKGNLLATKEVSLMAAQRAAVEKAVGVLVTGQMVVARARLIEDQVFSKSAGYMKSWEVLEEREEEGLYTTRISARVKLGDVRQDLDSLGLLIRTKKVGNPRVMILLEESVDDQVSESRTAETGLTKQLLQSGYKVVDAEQLHEIELRNEVLQALRGDEAKAADLARRFGAEICLVGSASVRLFAAPGEGEQGLIGDMISYRGRLNVKAIKAASGQVILAESREAASMDLSKEGAALGCLAQLAEETGHELASGLAPALFEGAEVQLVLEGLKDFGGLKDVVDSVRAADGVQQVVTRSFAAETVMDVELGWGNAQTLAAHLEAQKGTPMSITEITAYRIRAVLKSNGARP